MTRSDMRCVSCGTVGNWKSVFGELIRCGSCGVQVTEQEAEADTLEFEASHAEWDAEQSAKYATPEPQMKGSLRDGTPFNAAWLYRCKGCDEWVADETLEHGRVGVPICTSRARWSDDKRLGAKVFENGSWRVPAHRQEQEIVRVLRVGRYDD